MSQAKSIYVCENCQKEYSIENRTNFKSNKFCCKSCLEEYNRNNQNNQIEIYNCEYCGAEFTRNKNSNAKCCCRKCTSKLNFLKYPELKEKVINNLSNYTDNIEIKQKAIEKTKETKKEKSEKRLLEIRKPYNCENCGKYVDIEHYFGSGRFCCDSCAKSYSSSHLDKKLRKEMYNKMMNSLKLHICPKCNKEFYHKGTNKNILCDNCKPKIEYKHTQEFTKSNCALCNREIFSFYKGTIYCDDCLYTHPEIEQHITLYTEDGKKISLKRTNEKIKNIFEEKVKNGTHKGWQVRPIESYPEKFFKKVLENNDIQYSFNHPIAKSSLGLDTCACYFLDFFIEPNIDLEIDGKQHQYEERKEHDIERDKNLSDNGYVVYRIPWNEINTSEGKEKMKEKIDAFIQWYHKLLK